MSHAFSRRGSSAQVSIDLLAKGIDLQLETAVVLLKSKLEAAQGTQANKDK